MRYLILLGLLLAVGCSESVVSCDEAKTELKSILTDPNTTFGTTSNRKEDIQYFQNIIKECKKNK